MRTISLSNAEFVAPGVAAEQPKSFWRKAYDRFVESQQARAERSVAAYLSSHGGVLTDDMEREIMARFSVSSTMPHQH